MFLIVQSKTAQLEKIGCILNSLSSLQPIQLSQFQLMND